RITLKSRDGVDTTASTLTFWPTVEGDGAVRTLIFFADTDVAETVTAARPSTEAVAADGMFALAPFGAADLVTSDPASSALLDSNAALMEMTQGRATPGAPFADLFEASEGPAALAQRLRQAINEPVELMLATQPPTAAHVHFARSPDGRGIAYVL